MTSPCRYDTFLCDLMAVEESGNPLSRPNRSKVWFHGLCLASVAAVFALVVLGGVVRVTGSGLGCPDWPLCYGKVVPPLRADAIIEYSHRLVASVLVGPLVFATCCFTWAAYRREKWLVASTSLALVLVLVQAGLGGITVLTELHGSLVAAHLAMAEALLACLIVVTIISRAGVSGQLRKCSEAGSNFNYLPVVAAAGIGVYVLIMTGSLVTVSGSTAACTQWPLCQGNLLPATQPQLIHMVHRAAAALIGVLLLYALHLGFKDKRNPADVRSLALLAASLFGAQVVVGALTVWLGFTMELRALHLALATLLWGTTVWLVVLSIVRRTSSNPESAHA